MSFTDILYYVILYPLVQIIDYSFTCFDRLFRNTGISIIGVSFVVTLLCLPLYAIAERWQQIERDKQKEMKPDVDVIKEVFHGDEQYMILSTYYRQNHYHPLMALRSSFGLLIQIPFFMAAYSCLSKMPALQGASFWFIKDMGKPDALFYIGSFGINILPIAMTIINMIAGAIYTKGFPVKEKVQIYGMAVIFLVLLYNSPAGLVLYWTMNNVLSLVKNIYYKTKHPLKSFWLSCCVLSAISIFYIMVFSNNYLEAKIWFSLGLAVIFILPLFRKLYNFIYDSILSKGLGKKKLCNRCFFISMIILVILLGLVIPASVISSSVQEFSFIDEHTNPIYFVIVTFFETLGGFLFWPTCIYFLFSKKTKTGMSFLFMVFALSALVNYFVFPGDYGDLSVALKFLSLRTVSHPLNENLINAACLLVVLVFAILMTKTKKIKFISSLLSIIAIALAFLFVKDARNINKRFDEYAIVHANNKKDKIETIEPVFHLSKDGNNVVIIMLDRAMGSFIPRILEERPELIENYTGFKFYPNTLSTGCHTLMGIPSIYGGYEYTPLEMNMRSDEKMVDKHNEALLTMPRLFSEHGFQTTVTDPVYVNYNTNFDSSLYDDYEDINVIQTMGPYTEIWKEQHASNLFLNGTSSVVERNFLWYGLFRICPTTFRGMIYDWGHWWNNNDKIEDVIIESYAVLEYMNELTDFKGNGNTYTFIENELTHDPLILSTPDYTLEENHRVIPLDIFMREAHYDVNMASLLMLSDWIDYLKDNDVYDNTRIIIVADHGYDLHTGTFSNDFKQSLRPEFVNPLLMVKDFNASGKLQYDDTFMTNADVPSIAAEGLIKNPVNPATGKAINMDKKQNGIYVMESHRWMPDDNGEYTLTINDNEWYFVHDDIFNPDNWTQEVPECL